MALLRDDTASDAQVRGQGPSGALILAGFAPIPGCAPASTAERSRLGSSPMGGPVGSPAMGTWAELHRAEPERLHAVLARPGLAEVLLGARAELDALLWRRDVRAAAASVATASVERGARASAAIDGADVFAADDSPMGRVLARAMAVTMAVPGQVSTFERA
ncbi:MAG: hypothetical protein ACKOW5_16030, partial [Actinomycetales bacterium]